MDVNDRFERGTFGTWSFQFEINRNVNDEADENARGVFVVIIILKKYLFVLSFCVHILIGDDDDA